ADGRHRQGRPRPQRPGGDRGGDGVGGVVEAVGVGEQERGGDHRRHGDVGTGVHPQDSLTYTPSMTWLTCSKESQAASSSSATSLSFMTVRPSYSPEYSRTSSMW